MDRKDIVRKLYDNYGLYYQQFDNASKLVDLYDAQFYRLIRREKLAKDSLIVDLGCGTGQKLTSLLSHNEANLVGCDPLVPMHGKQDNRLSYCKCTIQEFLKSADDNSVDVFILNAVLEHLELEDVLNVLTECARVMKENGIVLCKVPNGASPFGGLYQLGDFTHKTAFNPFSFKQIALLAGFEGCRCYEERLIAKSWSGIRRYMIVLLDFFARGYLRWLSVLIYKTKVVLTPNFVTALKK